MQESPSASGHDTTRATTHYPVEAIAAALKKISSQGLWILLSLDHYGWRAEYDVIRRLLSVEAPLEHEHGREHAQVVALGQLFALVDKLWRLIYAIRAHRAGDEFLNATNGYLAPGYKLHTKLVEIELVTPTEWAEILAMPSPEAIRKHLGSLGFSADAIATRIEYASDLPDLVALNMRELQQYVETETADAGPLEQTFSLRQLDGQYRHGAPVVYLDCAPVDTDWLHVTDPEEETTADTVGIVMAPPDGAGTGYINLFKHDAEMSQGLVSAATTLACLVRRLTRAYLNVLEPSLLSSPLAAVSDYDV